MDYALVLFTPPDSPDSGLDDVRLPLYFALLELGHNVDLLQNSISPIRRNIIFGYQDRPDITLDSLPPDTIIYNLEQVIFRSRAMQPHYLEALRHFPVWDYSERNIEKLRHDYGVKTITHVPLGYMPQMTKINPDYPKDIDVLLYGCPCARRTGIINELKNKGVNALLACDVFGGLRDGLIARSRLLLNVHFHVPGILEVVRLSYLWANRIPVVSELNEDTEAPAGYEQACVYSPYQNIVEQVLITLEDEQLCRDLGNRGHNVFAARKYTDILRKVLN